MLHPSVLKFDRFLLANARASRSLAEGIAAGLIVVLGSATPAFADTTPLDLPALIAAAERGHPEIAAARAMATATARSRAANTALPEPTLSVAVQPMPVETRVGPQRLRVSAVQPLPWLTKLNRRGTAVDRAAAVADRRVDALRARVRREIRVPWSARMFATVAAGLVQQQHDLLVALEPTLLARLRIGAASYEEAQRLRLVIGQLALRRATLLDNAEAAAAAVRAAAGVGAEVTLAPPDFEADPGANVTVPALAELLPALDENPEVAIATAAIAAAQAEAAVVETRGLPDFAVGVDWIAVGEARMPNVADSGSDTLMLMAAVKLPLWRGSYDAAADAARGHVAAARAGRDAALRRAEAQLARLLADLRDARRRRDALADDLVPRATAALKTAIGSYSAGRASFQDLISLEQRLLQLQLEQAEATAAQVRARADLDWLLGRSLVAASTTEIAPPAPTEVSK